jgi:hypothetical protein
MWNTSPPFCPASHSFPRHITPRTGGRLATSQAVIHVQYCLTEMRIADRGGLLGREVVKLTEGEGVSVAVCCRVESTWSG